MSEYVKCDKDNYCKWLMQRTGEFNPMGKGLMIQHLINLDTGKMNGSYIIYKKDRKDNGLLLNFCPFCGFSFYDLIKQGKRVGCSDE